MTIEKFYKNTYTLLKRSDVKTASGAFEKTQTVSTFKGFHSPVSQKEIILDDRRTPTSAQKLFCSNSSIAHADRIVFPDNSVYEIQGIQNFDSVDFLNTHLEIILIGFGETYDS